MQTKIVMLINDAAYLDASQKAKLIEEINQVYTDSRKIANPGLSRVIKDIVVDITRTDALAFLSQSRKYFIEPENYVLEEFIRDYLIHDCGMDFRTQVAIDGSGGTKRMRLNLAGNPVVI